MTTTSKKRVQTRVYLDISDYWPKDDGGLRSVNSVYTNLLGTEYEIGRHTLRLALDGRLDRGHFEHVVRLKRLASLWAGKEIALEELLKTRG